MSTTALAGRPRQAASKPNIGDVERLLSVVGGGAMVVAALAGKGKASKLLLPLAGGLLVHRGVSGHCALYSSLGVSTASATGEATAVRAGHGVKVEDSITIRRPIEELYAFWRKFEQLPRFMHYLREVKVIDATRSHWVARAPLGMTAEWDAEIIGDKPNEMISWKSLPGASVDTAGSVHFHKAPAGRGTEIRVSLKFDPPAGKVGAWLAWLAGQSPKGQVREDLRRLQQLMEAGEIPTTQGQPSGRA